MPRGSWDNMWSTGALARLQQPGFASDSYSRQEVLSPLVQQLVDLSYQNQNLDPRFDYNSILNLIDKYPEFESVFTRTMDESIKQRRWEEKMKQRGQGTKWDTLNGLDPDTLRRIF